MDKEIELVRSSIATVKEGAERDRASLAAEGASFNKLLAEVQRETYVR